MSSECQVKMYLTLPLPYISVPIVVSMGNAPMSRACSRYHSCCLSAVKYFPV